MRRFLMVTALVALNLTVMAAKKQVIDRIEPTDWYVGMKNPTVQLMVYGKGIRDVASVTTDYPGVTIDSLVRLDSPNYLLVYLNLKGAQPGTMTLKFRGERLEVRGKKIEVQYQLKQREMSGDKRMGFTNADVLYMLMPDRFAQGAGHNPQIKGMRSYVEDRTKPSLRHGGDLNGIREHLDYFKELGVTALWFTPVLENNSPDSKNGYSTYHGYATTNYYKVDPRFGSNADYKRLCDEAHAKGLKIVMDMIFNHSGFEHPWTQDMPSKDWLNTPDWLTEQQSGRDPMTGFASETSDSRDSRDSRDSSISSISSISSDPSSSSQASDASQASQASQASPASKYLQTSYKLTPVVDPYASKIDLKETTEGWFVPSMPDLNQHNPHLMRYLIQNSIWWIETVGIDGIRMDTYPYAYADAMAQWMKELDDEYPNFNTVGETWVTEPAYTAAWQKDSKLSEHNSYLKTVMDFSFFDKLNQAKNEETDGWWNGLNRLYNSFVYDYLYPNPASVMAFIENHDTDRFLGNGRDTLALKQALALLLTVKRIPQLYYGTEVLMNGTKEVTDGNVRCDFPGGFPGDKHNCFTKEGRTRAESAMFNWLSRLLHWRQGNKAIIEGSQTQFIPYNGIYVIARQHEGRTVLTVLNGTSKPAKMEMARYQEVIGTKTKARDILTNRYFDLTGVQELKPRQSLILEF
ncbi:MAG: cyclomaltodextrinase N-terminal domain-containing protein [Prevotella sp.]|nr:cyclomaltodextrinase N-terminal domain-containing protein [Prevotella sp.]